MTVSRLDFPVNGCDDIFPERIVYLLILLLEFLFIFWLKIPLKLFEHLIIHVIFPLHSGKSISRIVPVELISCDHSLVCGLLLLSGKL